MSRFAGCLVATAGALLFACADDGAATTAQDPERPDEVDFDVTWKEGTIVVPKDLVDASVVDPFVADGVFEFAAPPDAITNLAPSQIVVLSGLGVFKVLDVQGDAAGAVIVTTEEAALTDAAEEGRIAWDIGFRVADEGRSGLGLVEAPITFDDPVAWRGDFGVDVIPGISQTPHATVQRASSNLDESAHTSKITTGVNVNFDAPRIDIGIGLVPPGPANTINMDEVTARVSYFAKLKTELVNNMEVLYDPLLGTLIGHCFRPEANFGILWGGETRFFGIRTSTEQTIYAIKKPGKPSGTVCK